MRPTHAMRLLLLLGASGCVEQTGAVLRPPPAPPPPVAVAPVPSAEQVAWQTQELAAFLHFGMNTFTNKEQGDGSDSPALFDPTAFDARQWITALRNAGVHEALLTAKHHDGFCLWPTQCTPYSVAASPFQGGQGDVVRAFVDAAHEGNVRVALGLSPLDRHEPTYGTPAYLAMFKCQLEELLTNYGAVDEIWLWQAPGTPTFDWMAIRDFVRNLQPQTLVEFSNAAPMAASDVRSIAMSAPVAQPVSDQSSVQSPGGKEPPVYIPAEAVYTIRPGWFWHAAEDAQVKTVDQVLALYLDSVGRNSLLRLNVPPDTRGLLAAPDVALLNQLGPAISALYRTNVAAGQTASADSVLGEQAAYAAAAAFDGRSETFWAAAAAQTHGRLEVDLGGDHTFDLLSVQEPIAFGERATQHHVEARVGGVWTTVATGTVIGQRKLHRISPVVADRVALVIDDARGAPAITEFGIYDTSRVSP